ncbi:acyl-coenzyme A synthetase/AMP-(fatty) acid ligase [Anaerosolibacter carboniphilus]|uniref:Acyl-coenzyme A synthetase/AMP-(Fatty) acid ligase n=1 Tax=Anaerosolibacter carboniphilus TaxID=1417629 RepID=A0A841KZU2_9FIRM|nr:fatty acid--CoA ligase family protein [Anaerosolibacter carboniphilus]MBB6216432.1 acyl-coenzyme A synthetase/AMP-(fatty) acid ligase [Anaerosolibacter carboniphilus]
MTAIETVVKRMRENHEKPAIFWKSKEYSYDEFFDMVDMWIEKLNDYNVGKGTVCGILSDYSPQTCALFFALMNVGAILVPFTRSIEAEVPVFREIAGVQCMFRFTEEDSYTVEKFDNVSQNELVNSFRKKEKPGLIVFSSGSTGTPKGILHDCERVMNKFVVNRPGWRTVLFLMMDHFGGFNTLLSTFAYGGTGICIPERTPESVSRIIEESKATLLPTTPTFLNLLIASKCYQQYMLDSIKLITYGTELMNEATLNNVKKIFPNAVLKQTYGLSELGVLRSKSTEDNSVWLKVGGDGFETKIIDNILWVRSEANMVGYLNAPNPFNEEGWMCTGDEVEVRGDQLRFLGRKSEIINVGGQKVYPVEVESVLLEDENIQEAAVFGVAHPLMGQVVHARVSLYKPEDLLELSTRLRSFCLKRLAKYKVPMRFTIISEEGQHSTRFKKVRLIKDEE